MEILSSRTLIHPADLQRSLDFYRDGLGLAVAYEFGSGDHRGTVFFVGSGFLEVVGSAGPPAGPSPVALWLQVRSAAAAVAELEGRGVVVDREPVLEPWGLIEAWIHDPDGHRIHLVEVPPGHPLRRDPRDPDAMVLDG